MSSNKYSFLRCFVASFVVFSAPNEYSIPTVLGTSKEGQIRSAPAYTIIGRHKKLPQPKTIVPGPGAYDGKFEIIFKSSPQFSIAERLSRSEKVIGPGPGAHHPEKVEHFE